jgi:hypothetical protein
MRRQSRIAASRKYSICFDAQGSIAEMSSPCATYTSREPDNQGLVAVATACRRRGQEGTRHQVACTGSLDRARRELSDDNRPETPGAARCMPSLAPAWLPQRERSSENIVLNCAPSAIRTRDLLLRRHSPDVARCSWIWRPSERQGQRLRGLPSSTATNLTIPRNGTVRENAPTAAWTAGDSSAITG